MIKGFIDSLKAFYRYITCYHCWDFDGIGESKESHWYWHLERCLKCSARREVLNDTPDACGHIKK